MGRARQLADGGLNDAILMDASAADTDVNDNILLNGTDSSSTDAGFNLLYEDGTHDASVALTPSSFTLDSLNVSGTSALRDTITLEGEIANGISFPASRVANTNVNTLDDYEEGTYTPTITFGGGSTGVAYGLQDGFYQKIGRMVKIDFRLKLTSKGSSTGVARVSLPFTASTQARPGSQTLPYGVNFNAFADTTAVNASLVGQGAVAGTATADLYLTTTGASLTQVNISNNSDFIGNLLYIAT